jgi:serine/threonine protein kinase
VSVGSRLGRYELLARIATGGMGEIFLARLEGAAGFEKLCVIKRILPHLAEDNRFRQMLIGEARIAANMSHPNICHVYELDESNRQLYIVMEYLEGVTLLGLLRKFSRSSRELDLGFVGGILSQVAAGLHYAHELRNRDGELLGIVHRDVTPSNIFLTESGIVKVHDFGVAKVKNAANTEAGTLKGKFAYMPPEQLQGGEIDRRVDVFALGVVLAEMLTGRRLFQRKTEYLTFRAVMEQPLPDFHKQRGDLPPALVAVLYKALARNPDERYSTARALGAAVNESLHGVVMPWSQSDISDLVQSEFANEIKQHNAEISSVISRVGRGSIRTMPLILQNPSEPEDGDYFAFETNVESEPLSKPEGFPLGATPRPMTPLVTSQPMQIPDPSEYATAPERPRSAVLPIALVLVAAAAVLVVGLMAIGGSSGKDDGKAPAAAVAPPSRALPGARTNGAYDDAVHARDLDLAKCAEHGDALGPDTRALVAIGTDGHAMRVGFEPTALANTALGRCVRNVLETISFPVANDEKELSIALKR